MEVLENIVKIIWYKPSNGDLPKEYGKYYTIDIYNEHRLLTFHPEGGWGGYNWEGEWGSNSMKSNDEIRVWTYKLPYNI